MRNARLPGSRSGPRGRAFGAARRSVGSIWVGQRPDEKAFASLANLGAAAKRNAIVLTSFVGICLALGWIYLRHAPSDYYAAVQFVLQPRHVAGEGPEDVRRYRQFALDYEQAETELQVLRSERALRPVFDSLHLSSDRELQCSFSSVWLQALISIKPGGSDCHSTEDQRFENFTHRVRTRRIGLSYVLEVAYRSEDPGRAVEIANALASTYLQGRIAHAIAAVTIGLPYLRSRATIMLAQSLAAAEAATSGQVPSQYLPDSDVRLLGPALLPLGRAYPAKGPILVMAAAIGIFGGLVCIVLLHAFDRRIHRFGIYSSVGRARSASESVKATHAAILAAPRGDEPLRVGFVGWSEERGTKDVAARFAALQRQADPATMFRDATSADREGGPGAPAADAGVVEAVESAVAEAESSVVVALPDLSNSLGCALALPFLNVIVLVVEAHRTTWADLHAARRLLRRSTSAFVSLHICDA